MKPWLISFFLFSFYSSTFLAQEQTLSCLQAPSRVSACPNMIYRSIQVDATLQNKMFCFCKYDFDLLFNKNVSDKQLILNRMELIQILSETNLTQQQLKKMVSR